MRALLLAAGYGTRLRPITLYRPKCLVEINGRPILDIWLEMLLNQGIERVLVNTHYMPDQVEQFLAASRWRHRVDTVFEEELLGTGGTCLANQDYFKNENFLVAHADNFTLFNLDDFRSSMVESAQVCMMTFDAKNPRNCGIVVTDTNGFVIELHEKVEKPPSNLANGAIYIFDKNIFELMKNFENLNFEITIDLLPNLYGSIATYKNLNYLIDIGSVEALAEANKLAKRLNIQQGS